MPDETDEPAEEPRAVGRYGECMATAERLGLDASADVTDDVTDGGMSLDQSLLPRDWCVLELELPQPSSTGVATMPLVVTLADRPACSSAWRRRTDRLRASRRSACMPERISSGRDDCECVLVS